MPLCLLGLGSNLGDPAQLLDDALVRLGSLSGVELLKRSSYRETAPVGGPAGQPSYLNAAAVIRTSLSPHDLLWACQQIENDLGRRRLEHWGPRTVDIDLLLYDDLILDSAELKIPHVRMAWRRFVLEPAAEIAAEMHHPTIGWTVARLLENLDSRPWYLALAGPIAVGKTSLAEELAERVNGRLLLERFDVAQLEAFYCNPSSHAWRIELEFLQQRGEQLDREQADWTNSNQLAISDYWFDQSAAFASVWLPPEQLADYMARWSELSSHMVRPRLLVLLQAPREALLARIRSRGRPGERRLTVEQIERIDEALSQRAAAAPGPVLRLDATDQTAAIVELTAAVQAMQ